MKYWIFSIIGSLWGLGALAHPGWGIVATAEGEIWFTDILHGHGDIWVIDSAGQTQIRFPHIHSHDLYRDFQGQVWGSDLRYLQATDEWETRLWKTGHTQEFVEVIPWEKGFEDFTGTNFVIGEEGALYFDYQNTLYRRDSMGKVNPLGSFPFQRICTLHPDGKGHIFISDSGGKGALYKMDLNGNVYPIAEGLKEDSPSNPPYAEPRFDLFFGMDYHDEAIYLCNSGSRRIWKITESGQVDIFYTSEAPWFPVGITFKGEVPVIKEVGFESGIGHTGPRILQQNPQGQYELLFDFTSYHQGVPATKEENRNPLGWVLGLTLLLGLGWLWAMKTFRSRPTFS